MKNWIKLTIFLAILLGGCSISLHGMDQHAQVQHKDDASPTAQYYTPPICYGVTQEDGALVELLIKDGANVNAIDQQGNTALMLAFQAKDPNFQIIRLLLDHPNIDLDIHNVQNKTVFDICVERNDDRESYVEMLFIKRNLPNDPTEPETSSTRSLQKINALKSMCASIVNNPPNIEDLVNPFVYLCNQKRLHIYMDHCADCIQLLLPVLDDPTHSQHACAYNCANAFIQFGSYIERHDYTKIKSLIEHSIKVKNKKLFELLLTQMRIDSYIFDHASGASALHLCARHNFPEGIKFLCENRGNELIELADKEGNTSLVWSIKHNNVACVQELLNHGCNPNPPCNVLMQNLFGQNVTIHHVNKVANMYCSDALPLLSAAQLTTIHDLPADIWAHIASYMPSGTDLQGRLLKFSNSLATTQKAVLSTIRNNFSPMTIATAAATDIEKTDMLFNALGDKQFRLFCRLLKQNNHLVNNTSPSGLSLLGCAPLCRADLSVMQALVDAGININTKIRFKLLQNSQFESVFLLPLKNDPTEGITAMDMLVIMFLCGSSTGLSERRQEELRETKAYACQMIKYLQSVGGKCSTQIPYENPLYPLEQTPLKSPLGIAIYNRSPRALKVLLAQPDIDPNVKIGAITPLVCAIIEYNFCLDIEGFHSCFEIITMLLEDPRININTVTGNNQTALDLASPIKLRLRHLLRSKGAKTAVQLDQQPAAAQPQAPAGLNPRQPGAPAINNNDHIAAAPAPAPVPGNNPPVIQNHWYKSSTAYWIAVLAACSMCGYGIYNYFWRDTEDEVGEEMVNEKYNAQDFYGPVVVTVT